MTPSHPDPLSTAEGLMPEGQAILPSPARSALREAAAALDLAELYKQPLEMSLALAQMARCYRALQALGPAELYLERALAWARTLGAADQAVEILCLLAETSCATGRSCMHRTIRGAAMRRWSGHATGPSKPPAWLRMSPTRSGRSRCCCASATCSTAAATTTTRSHLQSRAMRMMYAPHAGNRDTEAQEPGTSVVAAP